METTRVSRRSLLASIGGFGVASLAGCLQPYHPPTRKKWRLNVTNTPQEIDYVSFYGLSRYEDADKIVYGGNIGVKLKDDIEKWPKYLRLSIPAEYVAEFGGESSKDRVSVMEVDLESEILVSQYFETLHEGEGSITLLTDSREVVDKIEFRTEKTEACVKNYAKEKKTWERNHPIVDCPGRGAK